jgi:hypothetical protein
MWQYKLDTEKKDWTKTNNLEQPNKCVRGLSEGEGREKNQ